MSTTELVPAPSHTQTGSGLLDAILRFRALGLVVALVVIVGATTAVNPRFLSTQSIRDILLATAITLLLAVGLTVVVLTRGIDLSVGSVLGLSAFGVGTLLQNNPGIPVPVAMLAGLAIGAACGLVNAVVVAFGKVPPLVATLGTLYVFRGIVYFWAGGSRISAGDMPAASLISVLLEFSASLTSSSLASWCSSSSGCSFPPTAPAATCTRSVRTRRRPAWPAYRPRAASSPRTS